MADHVVVYVTAASEVQARRIARRLLQNELIAAANFAPVDTMFLWKGDIQEEEEVSMILITRVDKFDQVVDMVKTIHTHDTPTIIALPILLGSREYLNWIDHEIGD
ncbi:MAG: divalent-cation tolerance protein CutA [Anaerolineae bacterium]|nr:divalent-cation tolerance protein CutA [Anaerolineae bacterium]